MDKTNKRNDKNKRNYRKSGENQNKLDRTTNGKPNKSGKNNTAKVDSLNQVHNVMLTSSKLVRPGGINSIEYVKQFAIMNTTVFTGDSINMFDNMVQQVIEAYATQRGYVSTVKASDIRDVLTKSYKFTASLLDYVKRANVHKLRNSQGAAIGKLLNATPGVGLAGDVGFLSGLKESFDEFGFLTPGPAKLSNAVYNSSVLSYIPQLVLPDSLFEELKYFFSSYFDVTKDVAQTTFLDIVPAEMIGVSDVSLITKLMALGDDVLAAINVKPDVRSICQLLGLNGSAVIEHDYNRDVKGTTMSVVRDEGLINMIRTTSFNHYASDDEDNSRMIVIPGLPYNPLDYADKIDVPEQVIYLHSFLNDDIRWTPIYFSMAIYETSLDEPELIFLIDDYITDTEDAIEPGNIYQNAVTNGFVNALSRYFRLAIAVNSTTNSIYSVNVQSMTENKNVFFIPAEAGFIYSALSIERVLGQDYRAKLQLMISNFPLSSVSGRQ